MHTLPEPRGAPSLECLPKSHLAGVRSPVDSDLKTPCGCCLERHKSLGNYEKANRSRSRTIRPGDRVGLPCESCPSASDRTTSQRRIHQEPCIGPTALGNALEALRHIQKHRAKVVRTQQHAHPSARPDDPRRRRRPLEHRHGAPAQPRRDRRWSPLG